MLTCGCMLNEDFRSGQGDERLLLRLGYHGGSNLTEGERVRCLQVCRGMQVRVTHAAHLFDMCILAADCT